MSDSAENSPRKLMIGAAMSGHQRFRLTGRHLGREIEDGVDVGVVARAKQPVISFEHGVGR
jgi:hypothetical protein